MKVKALGQTWDGNTWVNSAEAEDLEPPSYSEPPLPVEIETGGSSVSEEIAFPWVEEPALTTR